MDCNGDLENTFGRFTPVDELLGMYRLHVTGIAICLSSFFTRHPVNSNQTSQKKVKSFGRILRKLFCSSWCSNKKVT